MLVLIQQKQIQSIQLELIIIHQMLDLVTSMVSDIVMQEMHHLYQEVVYLVGDYMLRLMVMLGIFLDASAGTIWSSGNHYVGSNVVWNAGNDGSGSGLMLTLLMVFRHPVS